MIPLNWYLVSSYMNLEVYFFMNGDFLGDNFSSSNSREEYPTYVDIFMKIKTSQYRV
jgi:hypothetical protein